MNRVANRNSCNRMEVLPYDSGTSYLLLPKLGQQKKVFRDYNALRLVVSVLLISLLFNVVVIHILNISDNCRIKPV
jgi:hypothetical protein